MPAVFYPEIWAENNKNFNKVGDVTRTISLGKAEFAMVVKFVCSSFRQLRSTL